MNKNSQSRQRHSEATESSHGTKLVGALLALALVGCQSVPTSRGLSATQIAALEQAGFHETDEGWELGFNDRLLFDTDRSDIRSDAKAAIVRLGQTLVKVNIRHVRVYGYTDSTGSDEYNEKLSQRRADAVSDTLVGWGMARDGIVSSGEGKKHPIADNDTPEGRAQNRRVAIVITTP